jgi:hypothetical protein
LLGERGVARDNGFADPEPGHLVADGFFRVGQCARELSEQADKQGPERFRSLGDVGIVIGRFLHGCAHCLHCAAFGGGDNASEEALCQRVGER